MSESKTNAMRILDKQKVKYTVHEYPHGKGAVDALTVAESMGEAPEAVFKTLVTKGISGNYFVFVLPSCNELDLKKAAKAAGEKAVEMIPVSEINKVTGYIRGGCSPVGMKKSYATFFAEQALSRENIFVSGGRIGSQIEAAPADLIAAVNGKTADITA